jgi:hypothetical protein
MSRVGLVRLAVAVFLAVSARPGVAQQPPQLGDYSVLALEDVLLKAGARLVSGAAGAVDGTVTLKRGARVAGTIVAGTLELARDSRVGRTFCGIVIGRPPLPACNLPPSPVVDPALLPPVSVVPGVNDLEVPSRTGIAPVGPGSFDEVIVGRGALLNLSGGDYTARSIRVAADGQLLCSEACRIGVAESIRLGARAAGSARRTCAATWPAAAPSRRRSGASRGARSRGRSTPRPGSCGSGGSGAIAVRSWGRR